MSLFSHLQAKPLKNVGALLIRVSTPPSSVTQGYLTLPQVEMKIKLLTKHDCYSKSLQGRHHSAYQIAAIVALTAVKINPQEKKEKRKETLNG